MIYQFSDEDCGLNNIVLYPASVDTCQCRSNRGSRSPHTAQVEVFEASVEGEVWTEEGLAEEKAEGEMEATRTGPQGSHLGHY